MSHLLLDILSDAQLPSHPVGLIADHPDINYLHFDHKLYILSEHISYPIQLDDNLTQIPYTMLPKYRFGGLPMIDILDFAVLIGVPYKQKPWLWGHVKVGGMALDIPSDDNKPLRFMLSDADVLSTRKDRWVIVSGCFRGATTYISDVLRAAGVDVHLQNYGHDGIASGAVIGAQYPEGTIAIHQVREPLATIASLTPKIKKIRLGLMPFMDFPAESSDLYDAMYYYYMVNYTASERGIWTYRVEDIDNVWDELLWRIGCRSIFTMQLDGDSTDTIAEAMYKGTVEFIKTPLPDISRTTNTRDYERPELTWASLYKEDRVLAELIEEQAMGYGYENR